MTPNWFLFLTLVLSIPFYVWGAVAPVTGLPFGLPISFLMIFVPFGLALANADRALGVARLFQRIFDFRRAQAWAAIFCLAAMPAAALLAYLTMTVLALPLPPTVSLPVQDIPLMVGLYFLGAIPEEFGWTLTVTDRLTARHGPVGAGALIGLVWALWHVIPWSWAHDGGWVLGMIVLNILMRIGMVLAYTQGGGSLFYALVFHTLINVCFTVFPNSGSHANPWLFSLWLLPLVASAWRWARTTRASPGQRR